MSSIFRLFSVSYLEQLNNDLCQAAAVGDAKMVECILSYGVSPNVHYSSLNLNVVRKNSKESTQLLLKHGAEIKARNETIRYLFIVLQKTTVLNLQSYYSNVMQKLKRGMQTITHLFTMLQKTRAVILQNHYSNVVQKLKRGVQTITVLFTIL